MSHSSTNLVFVQLDLSSYVQGTTGYKNELYLWPKQLDVKARICTFPLGAELTVFLPPRTFVLVQLVQLDLSSYVQETTGYKNELYLSPRQLDVKVKICTLPGAELAVFPQEQTVSGGVKVESCPSKRGAVCLPLSFPASSAHDLTVWA